MQVLRSEIRPEIRSMAEDRPILHQAVAQKDLLARDDIRAGEQRGSIRCLDDIRYGRFSAVGVVRKHAEDEEPENQDNYRRLNPTDSNQQRTLFNAFHR